MIGRSGFHGLLRNLRVSPWTRRSLTESLLVGRVERSLAHRESPRRIAPLPPSTALMFRAWQASVSRMLHHKDAGAEERKPNHPVD